MVKGLNGVYDIGIIGAGIVGLATAYQISRKRPDLKIVILEKEAEVAAHQSGHNSGVIHSGIYYTPGGSKALNCLRGYAMLLEFCAKYDIPHEVCGKVIVACDQKEMPQLEQIKARGIANGLQGLKMLRAEEVNEKEPHVSCMAGIWVPQAGIVDYKSVAKKYQHLIQQHGATMLFNTQLTGMDIHNGVQLLTNQGDLSVKLAINCAGLYSDKIARLSMPELDIRILPFRGEYYQLKTEKQYLVNNLIYPTPNPNFPFLGVHFTRMMKGGIEAGPNAVLAFKREGYSRWDINFKELSETLVFPGFRRIAAKYWRDGWEEMKRSYSKKAFVSTLQRLIPAVQEADLVAAGAGVRAMACDPKGNLIDDFLFLEKPGVINVCNAPSPAATSSLSIGETIAEKAIKRF
ncbi:MAG TPA: L-2-hydroxyglutarate oxidase [Saprospiraceae bacterium]|nr:L-2-hydroxyglutarate oxidase [Saprospiraceae bacterium]HMQ83753.1 L-2-hydroxyglutarate oxidase [Saprospiraceae bacterium]